MIRQTKEVTLKKQKRQPKKLQKSIQVLSKGTGNKLILFFLEASFYASGEQETQGCLFVFL